MIDPLEKEGDVIPSGIPTPNVQRVLISGPRSDGGMVEIGEVVVVAMDDDGCRLDFSGVIPSRGCTTNGQSKTKREETNTSHEGEDEADEADLLSPGPLLFGSSDATGSE